jgi:sugar transferase (PEP-CTERM/EpsH1 system associated)
MSAAFTTRETEAAPDSNAGPPPGAPWGALRVMHVVNRLATGGTEHVVLQLIGGLGGEAFEHRIAALRGRDPALGHVPLPGGELLLAGDESARFQFPLFRLARLMRAWRPHIVHSRNWGTIEAIPAARLAGVPVAIHSEHGYEIEMLAGLPTRRRLFRRAAYGMADAVFAVTRELRDYHARQAWLRPDRIGVIYNGVDTRRFAPRPEEHVRIREALGVPAGRFVVGTVGRMVPIKDHPTLLRAAEIMAHGGADVHVLLVGAGPELERNQQIVKASGVLSGRVTFTGASGDVPNLLQSLDAFALPSISEGMSNTLLEAMATGLPVIATAVGGNPEIIEEDRCGTLFRPGDAESLAAHLAQLAGSEEFRRERGAAARRRAEERFSLKRMLEDYSEMYRTLAARRGVRIAGTN